MICWKPRLLLYGILITVFAIVWVIIGYFFNIHMQFTSWILGGIWFSITNIINGVTNTKTKYSYEEWSELTNDN